MEVTVLIPTHDHCETLLWSVASVQRQSISDWEILIAGDGVPERTRTLVKHMMEQDSRIRFFDYPKGPRHGEIHRHATLAHARGRLVCYMTDDDLWLPGHLEEMCRVLQVVDLAHTSNIFVSPAGDLFLSHFDINDAADRSRLFENKAGFGLETGGHTLAAYRRLPEGWRTTPVDLHTDLYMWRQFLEQPGCLALSSQIPTVLHFGSPYRKDWAMEQRMAELSYWSAEISRPNACSRLLAKVLQSQWHGIVSERPVFKKVRIADELPIGRCPTGETIRFVKGCGGDRYLSWGWSDPEPWGIWTDGEQARLFFELEKRPRGDILLSLRTRGFVTSDRAQIEVQPTLNGHPLEKLSVEDYWATRRMTLPLKLIGERPVLDLRLLIPSATSPAEAGVSTDTRRLGLGLEWIQLDEQS
jgi:glycosyltransferase involved in cell wall biosynthesis